MHGSRLVFALALVLSLAAPHARHTLAAQAGVAGSSSGGGHYTITLGDGTILEIQFAYSAILHGDGRASGHLHHQGLFQGQMIDFTGEVTCLSVDGRTTAPGSAASSPPTARNTRPTAIPIGRSQGTTSGSACSTWATAARGCPTERPSSASRA
ncbi:MAG: hypothetical protein ACRD26_03280 [Vicinamibacterales bacterium]